MTHDRINEIQAAADFWVERLHRTVSEKLRQAFHAALVEKLSKYHPAFLAVGHGGVTCPVLRHALDVAEIGASNLKMTARVRIESGKVLVTESGLTTQYAGEKPPAYFRPRASARIAW